MNFPYMIVSLNRGTAIKTPMHCNPYYGSHQKRFAANLGNPALNSKPYRTPITSVLPPLSNSWIRIIRWLYIAVDRTPNIDC